MDKMNHYHTEPHGFSLTTPTREHIIHLLDQLPSLDEVLQRQSRPPVCLYNYYIVLRDRLHMETLLDFWLDVQQAEVLYRRHLKQQSRKQNKNNNNNNNHNNHNNNHSKSSPQSPISTASFASEPELLTHMLLMQSRPFSPTTKRFTTTFTKQSSTSLTTTTSSSSLQSPHYYPSQSEMVDTNERIYYRYIVPHAEKELIQLPAALRDRIIHSFNTGIPLDDPKVFQTAKRYVHILLQTSFTLFIRYKVFMNLTLPQQLFRLAAGLFSLLVGFSLEFSLIFLNILPWSIRLWRMIGVLTFSIIKGIFPITFGIYCLCSSICGLDPIWVLCFNISETTTFKFNAIKQNKVRKILRKRSIALLSVMVGLAFFCVLIFCVIPGTRL